MPLSLNGEILWQGSLCSYSRVGGYKRNKKRAEWVSLELPFPSKAAIQTFNSGRWKSCSSCEEWSCILGTSWERATTHYYYYYKKFKVYYCTCVYLKYILLSNKKSTRHLHLQTPNQPLHLHNHHLPSRERSRAWSNDQSKGARLEDSSAWLDQSNEHRRCHPCGPRDC